MSKRTNSKYKISRRLGVNLWGRAKDPSILKNYPPGQHGAAGRKKESDYANQLHAKQRLKGYYGNITEKQFRRLYQLAVRRKGDTGENLIALLESRLDAVIYRANFVPTMFAARQFISHKHITVNGRVVNIPSCNIKPGDVVAVRNASQQVPMVIESTQKLERDIPPYLEADAQKMTVKLARLPQFSEVPYPVVMQPNMVIEFYSR